MAPPGPPPYTIDQINAMSTKEERVRARAELNSYIARMKKEQQDRLARSTHAYRGGPQRGGYAYGRGAASYHPYQRPPPSHGAVQFKNRTVVFNKPDASAGAPGTESVSAPGSAPPSTAHSRPNSPPPTEPKPLCATFTSTGTPDNLDAPGAPLGDTSDLSQAYARATAAPSSTIRTSKRSASAGSSRATATEATAARCPTSLPPTTSPPVCTSKKDDARTRTVDLLISVSTRLLRSATLSGALDTVRRAPSAQTCTPTSVPTLPTKASVSAVTNASTDTFIVRPECGSLLVSLRQKTDHGRLQQRPRPTVPCRRSSQTRRRRRSSLCSRLISCPLESKTRYYAALSPRR